MTIFVVLLLLVGASPLLAQRSGLDRADSLIAAGQYAAARSQLEAWQREHPTTSRTDPAERARALFLSARLTEDAARAQELYVRITLGYPTSGVAPAALLRLGQAWFANGEPRRSVTYLERVLNDYPTAADRPDAFLWLIRAHRASLNPDAACNIARQALASESLTREQREVIGIEARECAGASNEPRVAPTPAPVLVKAPPKSGSANEQPARPPVSEDARFAVQTGAFREPRSAAAVAARLRRAGFDARVAYVRSSSLARVRIGRLVTRREAAALATRVKSAGFNAIIVDDVQRERR